VGSRIAGEIRRVDGRPVRPADALRVAFNVYPACEGGDRYDIGEAREACGARASGPRAADLVIAHLKERMGGRFADPGAGRIVRQGS
jgi:hypothetical protein